MDKPRANGFTLIEMVMTIIISLIVFYPMLSVFSNIASKSPTLESLAISSSLASSKLEEVSNRKFENILSIPSTSFGGSFSEYNYSVTVNYVSDSDLNTPVDPTITDYKLIKVNVRGVEISTLATKISNEK